MASSRGRRIKGMKLYVKECREHGRSAALRNNGEKEDRKSSQTLTANVSTSSPSQKDRQVEWPASRTSGSSGRAKTAGRRVGDDLAQK